MLVIIYNSIKEHCDWIFGTKYHFANMVEHLFHCKSIECEITGETLWTKHWWIVYMWHSWS